MSGHVKYGWGKLRILKIAISGLNYSIALLQNEIFLLRYLDGRNDDVKPKE